MSITGADAAHPVRSGIPIGDLGGGMFAVMGILTALLERNMINARLNELLSGKPSAYWLRELEEKRIPCAPVNRLSQALSDPQVKHRNMVVELRHPNGKSTRGPGNPIKFSRSSEETFSAAPLLGQQTHQVLSELLGYDTGRIERLRATGAIG